MQKQTYVRPFPVWILIILHALLGFGAVVSGAMLMLSPTGALLQMPLSVLGNAPFSSFFIPGLILFSLLGVYPLAAAYGLWKRPAWRWPDTINPFKQLHWSWAGSLATGVIVIIWLSVELFWVEMAFLHVLYYAWAGLILFITLLPVVRRFYKRGTVAGENQVLSSF